MNKEKFFGILKSILEYIYFVLWKNCPRKSWSKFNTYLFFKILKSLSFFQYYTI